MHAILLGHVYLQWQIHGLLLLSSIVDVLAPLAGVVALSRSWALHAGHSIM